MKRILVLGILLSLGVCSKAIAAEYKIDPTHSSVAFKIRHLTISNVSGQFTDFNGKFTFEPANVASSSTQVVVKMASVNTHDAKRDEHLRGPDFFDAEKFPEMSFRTISIDPISPKEFKAHGELTLHGVTKPATLAVNYGGTIIDPWGNERAAFTATTKINRKDFGLTWNKVIEAGGLMVGEDIDITLEVEGIKQK